MSEIKIYVCTTLMYCICKHTFLKLKIKCYIYKQMIQILLLKPLLVSVSKINDSVYHHVNGRICHDANTKVGHAI